MKKFEEWKAVDDEFNCSGIDFTGNGVVANPDYEEIVERHNLVVAAANHHIAQLQSKLAKANKEFEDFKNSFNEYRWQLSQNEE